MAVVPPGFGKRLLWRLGLYVILPVAVGLLFLTGAFDFVANRVLEIRRAQKAAKRWADAACPPSQPVDQATLPPFTQGLFEALTQVAWSGPPCREQENGDRPARKHPPPITCGRLEFYVNGEYRQLLPWKDDQLYPVRHGPWGIQAFDARSGILALDGETMAPSERTVPGPTIAWFELRPGAWFGLREDTLVISGTEFHPVQAVTPSLCGAVVGPRFNTAMIRVFEQLVSGRWSRTYPNPSDDLLPQSIRFIQSGQFEAVYAPQHCAQGGTFQVQDGILHVVAGSANHCGRATTASPEIASSNVQEFSNDVLSLCARNTSRCEGYRLAQ